MRRRFWVSVALSLPLLVIVHGDARAGWCCESGSSLALATPVVLWAGWPFFVRAVQSIVTRNLNMFTLIGLGVGVAYVYSLPLPLIFGHGSRTSTSNPPR